MSTATVGPADNLDIDDDDEAGTATPTIAGEATALVLVPLGTEGRSGAGGMGLKGGIVEPFDVAAEFGGVLTTIGFPLKKQWD